MCSTAGCLKDGSLLHLIMKARRSSGAGSAITLPDLMTCRRDVTCGAGWVCATCAGTSLRAQTLGSPPSSKRDLLALANLIDAVSGPALWAQRVPGMRGKVCRWDCSGRQLEGWSAVEHFEDN